MNRLLLLSLALAAGCSSLVDDHCARGYVRDDGTCVVRAETDGGGIAVTADARMEVEILPTDPPPHDAGPDGNTDGSVDGSIDGSVDGGIDGAPDAMVADAAPDAFTCTPPLTACYEMCVDLQTDPDHCGSCTHACASGICTAGHCEGEPWGHVVAIGHDYTSSHASQRRVLANAVALGASSNVGVAWWPSETSSTAHRQAFVSGMSAIGRTWHELAFPTAPGNSFAGIDVVVVGPDTADGDAADATGAVWAAAFDSFLRTGGVIVVLDGANGTNYRFAHGAQLFDVGAPFTVTGQPTAVVDQTDSIANQVVAPYLAEASSVAWPGAPQPVVTTMGGTDTIVFHVTR